MDKITFKSINESLINVNFSIKPDSKIGTVKPQFRDEIVSKNINEDGFDLIFTRSIGFDPVSILEIEVIYNVNCTFTDESKSFYKGSIIEISKFIEKRQVEIIESTKAISKASLIIASLTNISKNTPLIVPPRIIKSE